MVNLRLLKTARPRFQTLRPRLRDARSPEKKTSRQTLLRFHGLAKI